MPKNANAPLAASLAAVAAAPPPCEIRPERSIVFREFFGGCRGSRPAADRTIGIVI